MPERGELWLANLNPRRGTEPGKTRCQGRLKVDPLCLAIAEVKLTHQLRC